MRNTIRPTVLAAAGLAVTLLLLTLASPAGAAVDGIEVTGSITLVASADFVTSADGGSIPIWGLGDGPGRPQYPAPTLILQQGDTVTINLVNQLGVATSLIFPGHDVAGAGGCTPLPYGATDLTCQAVAGGSASYTFTAEQPGTYLYHSGTDIALQVDMGLVGAIVVRPYGYDSTNPTAYGHPDSAYDREYLFVLSEMDSRIHFAAAFGDDFTSPALSDLLGDYFPNYWFINGRTGPDTMAGAGVSWLPTQPYNILPQMHPGETVLMRVVGAGRDPHPYHHHGNHALLIARNGRLQSTGPGAGADLAYEVFTTQTVPGETYDLLFTWTGEKMNWDIYGPTAHTCNDGPDADLFDDVTHEYCPDHGKAFPVVLPEKQDLNFGGFWSGSPFMGAAGALPPGEGGLNPNSGYTFMWHSHTEKELINDDIFPGGMLTMLIVQPPGVPIVE